MPPPATSPWRDLPRRVLSAAVLAPLALFCLWYGGWAFRAMLALALFGMAWEWRALCNRRPDGAPLLRLVGLLYITLAVLALFWLCEVVPGGRLGVLLLLFLVWASDIGGYVAGRALGGRRLAPAISPGKTWSGAGGGLFAAVALGAIAGWRLGDPLWWGALVGGGLGVVAQTGDLLESAMKRHCGAKDSGWLIPGHGGLLDRLDGVLAAAPAAAALVWLTGGGGLR